MENFEEKKEYPLQEKEPVQEIKWGSPEILERELGEIFRVAGRFAKNSKERTGIPIGIVEALVSRRVRGFTQ